MKVELIDDEFRIIIQDASGIEQMFKIKLDLEYTTPNEKILTKSFTSYLNFSPHSSSTIITE